MPTEELTKNNKKQKAKIETYKIAEDLKDVKRPEDPKRVQHFFTSVAKKYDLANTVMSFGRHYSWKRFTTKVVEPKEGQTGVDVCAGSNDIAILLARIVGQSGKVVSLDFNEAMQEVGKFKAKKHGLDNIEHVLADAEALPFEDKTFDFLTIGTAARHLRAPNALAEWYRVLKPGAKMACLEFYSPHNRIWRAMYNWYSYNIMPKVGALVARDKSGVYNYLPDSIRVWYTEERYQELMQEAGFVDVQFRRFSGGIACVHWGSKP